MVGGSARATLAAACLVLGLPQGFVELARLGIVRAWSVASMPWRRRRPS